MKSLLELLSEKHTDWIKMVRSFNHMPVDEATGYVHDMYIRMDKYVKEPERVIYENGEINTMFVYITLRNLYYRSKKNESKRTNPLSYDDETIEYQHDNEYDEVYGTNISDLEVDMRNTVNGWHAYDSKLFKLIYYDGNSMRHISRETNISMTSIFNTIKNCRNKLKEEYQQQYNNL